MTQGSNDTILDTADDHDAFWRRRRWLLVSGVFCFAAAVVLVVSLAIDRWIVVTNAIIPLREGTTGLTNSTVVVSASVGVFGVCLEHGSCHSKPYTAAAGAPSTGTQFPTRVGEISTFLGASSCGKSDTSTRIRDGFVVGLIVAAIIASMIVAATHLWVALRAVSPPSNQETGALATTHTPRSVAVAIAPADRSSLMLGTSHSARITTRTERLGLERRTSVGLGRIVWVAFLPWSALCFVAVATALFTETYTKYLHCGASLCDFLSFVNAEGARLKADAVRSGATREWLVLGPRFSCDAGASSTLAFVAIALACVACVVSLILQVCVCALTSPSSTAPSVETSGGVTHVFSPSRYLTDATPPPDHGPRASARSPRLQLQPTPAQESLEAHMQAVAPQRRRSLDRLERAPEVDERPGRFYSTGAEVPGDEEREASDNELEQRNNTNIHHHHHGHENGNDGVHSGDGTTPRDIEELLRETPTRRHGSQRVQRQPYSAALAAARPREADMMMAVETHTTDSNGRLNHTAAGRGESGRATGATRATPQGAPNSPPPLVGASGFVARASGSDRDSTTKGRPAGSTAVPLPIDLREALFALQEKEWIHRCYLSIECHHFAHQSLVLWLRRSRKCELLRSVHQFCLEDYYGPLHDLQRHEIELRYRDIYRGCADGYRALLEPARRLRLHHSDAADAATEESFAEAESVRILFSHAPRRPPHWTVFAPSFRAYRVPTVSDDVLHAGRLANDSSSALRPRGLLHQPPQQQQGHLEQQHDDPRTRGNARGSVGLHADANLSDFCSSSLSSRVPQGSIGGANNGEVRRVPEIPRLRLATIGINDDPPRGPSHQHARTQALPRSVSSPLGNRPQQREERHRHDHLRADDADREHSEVSLSPESSTTATPRVFGGSQTSARSSYRSPLAVPFYRVPGGQEGQPGTHAQTPQQEPRWSASPPGPFGAPATMPQGGFNLGRRSAEGAGTLTGPSVSPLHDDDHDGNEDVTGHGDGGVAAINGGSQDAAPAISPTRGSAQRIRRREGPALPAPVVVARSQSFPTQGPESTRTPTPATAATAAANATPSEVQPLRRFLDEQLLNLRTSVRGPLDGPPAGGGAVGSFLKLLERLPSQRTSNRAVNSPGLNRSDELSTLSAARASAAPSPGSSARRFTTQPSTILPAPDESFAPPESLFASPPTGLRDRGVSDIAERSSRLGLSASEIAVRDAQASYQSQLRRVAAESLTNGDFRGAPTYARLPTPPQPAVEPDRSATPSRVASLAGSQQRSVGSELTASGAVLLPGSQPTRHFVNSVDAFPGDRSEGSRYGLADRLHQLRTFR